jgi:hypothetical protein
MLSTPPSIQLTMREPTDVLVEIMSWLPDDISALAGLIHVHSSIAKVSRSEGKVDS